MLFLFEFWTLCTVGLKYDFIYNFQICLNNMGWIRIRMDTELLPWSGTRKIQSWIRIHNTVYHIYPMTKLSTCSNYRTIKTFSFYTENVKKSSFFLMKNGPQMRVVLRPDNDIAKLTYTRLKLKEPRLNWYRTTNIKIAKRFSLI